jgi:hypothetical protein
VAYVNSVIFGIGLGSLLLLSGCGRYRIKLLRPLCKTTAQYKGKKDGVTVYVGRLDQRTAREYFNGRQLPYKQTVPLVITVKNDSPYSLVISRRHISLPLLSGKELIAAMERSEAIPLVAGFGTAVVADAVASAHHSYTAGALASGAAMVTGVAAAIKASTDNERFPVDLRGKMLSNETLWPGEQVTKLIFASRELFHMPFTIRVCQVVENAQGGVIAKRVIPFKVNFFNDDDFGDEL